MTDAPTDKKLNERFAEFVQAWKDGGDPHEDANTILRMGRFAIDRSDTILRALCLAESHPSAIREAVEGESSQAAADVIAERQRQVSAEGWTAEHDDEHKSGEMALAASAYAEHAARFQNAESVGMIYATKSHPSNWPWHRKWWKPKDYRRDLVRAGALIIAEIERLDRAAAIRAQGEEKGNG